MSEMSKSPETTAAQLFAEAQARITERRLEDVFRA
jgi:hypothetical protein